MVRTGRNVARYSRCILLNLVGVLPFLPQLAGHMFKGRLPRGVVAYALDCWRYARAWKPGSEFPLTLPDTYPCLYDRYENAGRLPRHYFHQDLWASRKVFASGAKVHYDIGSRVDGFIAQCLVFCKVVMIDVRPLGQQVAGLEFVQADAMDMRSIKTGAIGSISSLHAIEHFGLGRYGDPIDPEGHRRAIDELQRVAAPGGTIYFSVPVGRQRLEFNAHRVFDPRSIIGLFGGCELLEFSVVTDGNILVERADPADYTGSEYACGLYLFRKRS
jgi:hypothetical protein